MPNLKRLRFSTTIAAPAATVHALMLRADTYRDWTRAFAEGSSFEGSWDRGARIRFMAPDGQGMVAEIVENRPGEFVSIRHLGQLVDGVEDADSESVRAWAPAYENYSFKPLPGGRTELAIEQDTTPDFEGYLAEAWPKALQRLKEICEAQA